MFMSLKAHWSTLIYVNIDFFPYILRGIDRYLLKVHGRPIANGEDQFWILANLWLWCCNVIHHSRNSNPWLIVIHGTTRTKCEKDREGQIGKNRGDKCERPKEVEQEQPMVGAEYQGVVGTRQARRKLYNWEVREVANT